jgi:hypothetical protein
MNRVVRTIGKVIFTLALPGLAFSQVAEVSYSTSVPVPVLGSGITLLLGVVLLVLGWNWLRKNPTSIYKNVAVGVITVGMLASVTSGGWMVSNANAVIAATSYLFSENPSPVMVNNFPAMLENDRDRIATIDSIVVSNCPGEVDISGTCQEGLFMDANGGSCSLDSVCLETAPTNCSTNTLWQPVNCTTTEWVWSSDRSFTTLELAEANGVLWVGDEHSSVPNTCSLDGTGWVSTEVFTMAGCNTSWQHIGGSYSGPCGNHDGDQVRRLTLNPESCFDYTAH